MCRPRKCVGARSSRTPTSPRIDEEERKDEMNTSNQIQLQVEAGIATLTLNRPEKRNAISDAMRTDLIAALEQVAADAAVRALVLTGTGKGFCAGGDVAGMQRRMDAPAGAIGFNGWSRQQRVHHSVSL